MNSELTLEPGKLPAEMMAGLLRDTCEARPEILVGPKVGEDACAIRIGDEVLVAATDPITMTGSGVGEHAVAINANDVAVMGVKPRWFLATVLLPVGSTVGDLRGLFEGMKVSLDGLGVALVGGHTEVSAAVNQPVVIGQMLGVAGPRGVVKTGGLRPGDQILQIGP
ncbi:MAG: AIR synthase related protein, partial [Verrucomicrobiota bacterium]